MLGSMTSRRSFLRRSALFAGAALSPLATAPLPGCAGDGSPYPPLPEQLPSFEESAANGAAVGAELFQHGVASGDPGATSVRLWTRLNPPGAETSLPVFYEVALDPAFQQRVAAGTVDALATRDFSVHVDVEPLSWGRTYYYRFRANGQESLVGRTRLAPEPGSTPARLTFGVVSCSNLARGWFHAYAHLAERDDLDAVLHLGDFLYEHGDIADLPRALVPPTSSSRSTTIANATRSTAESPSSKSCCGSIR